MPNDLERNQAARREADMPYFRPGTAILRPFALLREMTDWMDQAFEGDSPIARGERAWAPAVEVRQQDGKILVSADLPGIDQKDVKVEVDNNVLVIQGERKREQTEDREGFHRSERIYGSFYRAIPLPENAKADNAKAEFKNGVLEVSVPVDQTQAQRRQIPVGAAQPQAQPQGTRK
jgi:HSP20 family protein